MFFYLYNLERSLPKQLIFNLKIVECSKNIYEEDIDGEERVVGKEVDVAT